MRIAALSLIGALGLGVFAMSADAAPIAPEPAGPQVSNIIEVAGGCGPRAHRNRWGHCRMNRYSYYGSYYGPRRHHHWHGYGWGSPSDRVANELNRQQLGRMGY